VTYRWASTNTESNVSGTAISYHWRFSSQVTESSLAAKAVNLNVAVENLTLRDGRVKIDNVKDDVEDELKKEVSVIEGIKRNLQQKCAQAFEQLCLLQVTYEKDRQG
jgi:hypothetical protein